MFLISCVFYISSFKFIILLALLWFGFKMQTLINLILIVLVVVRWIEYSQLWSLRLTLLNTKQLLLILMFTFLRFKHHVAILKSTFETLVIWLMLVWVVGWICLFKMSCIRVHRAWIHLTRILIYFLNILWVVWRWLLWHLFVLFILIPVSNLSLWLQIFKVI